MKLNISYPATGSQKVIEVDDENKLRAFYDKRMSTEVEGDILGDEFKGYVFKISGGNDKQGFAMKQGLLTTARVRLLFSTGHTCFRPRKAGERKRKSIRGSIVSSELSVLNLVVIKKGEQDIQGLTDQVKPRRHGPKRANNIRKLFNLGKKDDVTQFVIKRRIAKEGQKAYNKYPKIQRLITPQRLQRKRATFKEAKERVVASKKAAEAYNALLAQRYKEQKEKRAALIQKRRSASTKKDAKPATTATATTTTTKPAAVATKPAAAATKPAAAAPKPAAAAPKPAAAAPAAKPAAAKPAAAKPAAAKPAAAKPASAKPASKPAGKQ